MSRRRKRGEAPAAASAPAGPAPPTHRGRAALAVSLLLAVGAAAVLTRRAGPPPSSASPSGPRMNLLLVTLDTTRADHLGAYGHARARTRHMDRLAREGVIFTAAYSVAPITLPAHSSILTGLNPPAHGVRNNGNFYLPETHETLATVLRAQGYRTAAFVSSFILDRRYGLARGFDVYDDRMEGAQAQVVALEAERRGDRTAMALSQWLQAQAGADRPFFAWLHLYDPHEPYHAPQPFRDAFKDAPYDGEIAFDDAIVASVLDTMGKTGVLDRTLVAVIADHGESLGDHGEETHSMFLYEAAIRVPLILWRPGVLPANTVVSQPVPSIDLAPTLLEVLGASPLPRAEGRSLSPLWLGKGRSSHPIYAETYLPQLYMNWSPLRALRDDRYKLIDAPRPELYDLLRDPQEQTNLYTAQAATAEALRRALDRATGGSEGRMSVGALDRETVEKLAALGYVGAGAAAPAGSSTLTDPKDVIAVFNRLRRANSAVRERRFADALPILTDVLREDPRNGFARLVMGSAHMGRGDYRQAITWYRRYLELVPTSAYAHQWMAICYLRLDEPANAEREASAALAIDPRFTDARVLRAGVLASRGDHPGAIAELRAAVATDPGKSILRLDLAKVLTEAGNAAEARTEFEGLLETQPDYAPALIGLGSLDAEAGRLDEASARFRRAIEVEPRQLEARIALGQLLQQQGRPVEAVEEYRRVADDARATPTQRAEARRRLGRLARP
jgi:choline-sulfatase